MTAPEKLSAFVLMPFDARFDDLYRFGIMAAVGELRMEATRVDEQVFHKCARVQDLFPYVTLTQ
jgi:hypothetical protein